MGIDDKETLKQAFHDGKSAPKAGEAQVPEQVPDRIKQDAPTPVLKPRGSWRARADAVDRSVREEQEAAKAKNEWAKRLKANLKQNQGKGFKRKR